MRYWFCLVLLLLSSSLYAISLADAVDRVRLDTNGEILSATTIKEDGKSVHRIKVLMPTGKVRIFKIPKDQKDPKDAHSAG
jgi:hypothetical protein